MLSFRCKAFSACAAALPLVVAGWLLLPGIPEGEAEELLLAAVGQPRQLFPQAESASDRGAGLAQEEQPAPASLRPPPPAPPPPSPPLPPSAPLPQKEARPLPPLPQRKPGIRGLAESKAEQRPAEIAATSSPQPPARARERSPSLSWAREAAPALGSKLTSEPSAVRAADAAAAGPVNVEIAAESDLGVIRQLVQQALDGPEASNQDRLPVDGHLPAAVIARQGAEAPPLAAPPLVPPPFDLRAWESKDFLEERQGLQQVIAKRERDGRPTAAQVLKLAKLYASRGLAHEALSLLADMEERQLLPRQRRVAHALEEILRVWQAPEAEHEGLMLGDVAYADWVDWPLWTAYRHAARHQWEEAAELAGEGLQRLDAYPSVLRVPPLIALTEALMMTGSDLTLAGEALRLLEGERLDKMDRTALAYLTALAQEARGEARQAFESYLVAARGDGPYAQKSRIAVVDVGLSSGQMSLEEGEALLSSAHSVWRGDRLEVEVLKRLAAIRLELKDEIGVLEALARLAINFSGQPIAQQALFNAAPLLDELYRSPERLQRPIAQRISEHEVLRQAFGTHPFFMSYREAFAGDLAEAGLKAAAALEYALLAEESVEGEKAAYSLKRAAILLEAGAHASAREVLQAMSPPLDPDLARQWRRLAARLVAAGEVPPREEIDAQLRADQDLAALLLRAEAAWSERNWPQVLLLYDGARRDFPEAFGETELLRLLIASYRQGEKELFEEVVRQHEALARGADWGALASMLMESPPSLNPLSSREARGVIEQAEDVRELVRRALKLPQV